MQVHLRLHPHRMKRQKVASHVPRVLKQRGLADPRLPAQDQCAAHTATSLVKEVVESTRLRVPPEELDHPSPFKRILRLSGVSQAPTG
jgi:hypothetical protein